MWARSIRWLLTTLGATMFGCQFNMAQYERRSIDQVRERDREAFNEAVARVAELRYDEAAESFARLIERFESVEDRARAAEAMFWLAYCHEKQGRIAEATALYNRLLQAHPRAPACRQAKQRLSLLPNHPASDADETDPPRR